MKDLKDLTRIMNTKTKMYQFCDTRADANTYCTKNRDWILML